VKEMKEKNIIKDSLVVGFAMFAVFFGAGNLVFPPQIGLVSGAGVPAAMFGLALSAILFPMLGFAAIGNVGNDLSDLTYRVHPKLLAFVVIVGLPGGLCGTLPRCGSVAFEVGVLGIFPELPSAMKWVFLIAFFGLACFLALNRSGISDIIGKFITPVLLVCLVVIVILAVVDPIGKIEGGVVENSFSNAFVTGINTGDIMTGVMCAAIFLTSLKEKGYTTLKERKMMLRNMIIVAFLILFVVYGGLCYLGAQGTALFAPDTDNTVLLVGLVRKLAGYGGIVLLSLAVILACFTTEAGLIRTMADLLNQSFGNRLNYKYTAIAITIVVALMAFKGVAFLINLAGPFFMLIFPVYIVLTILGVCYKWVPNDGAWKGAVLMSLIVGLHDAIATANAVGLISIDMGVIGRFFAAIPLAQYGFTWVIPSIVGGIIGAIVYKMLKKESLPFPTE